MIMPIAIAKDGFIDINETPNFSNNDNFLQCLQKIFNFENKDLQFFDGNTCRLINSYDPTNSIFIYENQQGVFLYQITNASPIIHKNNMIWLCNCYKMEDFSKINSICESGKSAQFNIIKNIYPSEEGDNKTFKKVEIKNNFETKEILQSRIGNNLCAFKIKCYVNPTNTISNLSNYSNDGSFNFYFPMLMFNKTTISGETETAITNAISLTTPTTNLKLTDIISKYSEQIKSIEFIPFFPTTIGEMGGGISNIDRRDSTTLYFDVIGNAIFTELGVFIPQGHYSESYDFVLDLPNFFLPQQILKGGGARGFLRTPLGNIQLDFELNKKDVYNNICSYYLKDDGWKIDGAFKCTVPPHYLNFYTDNAGQVFIQNLTTNAQELRQLERENIAKYEEQEQQRVLNALTSASNINPLNIGDYINFGKNLAIDTLRNEYLTGSGGQFEREYKRSLAEYEDKIQTQSLLASLQGKQISGNVGLLDFLESFNCDFFKLFIELNFNLQYSPGNKHIIICQKNYDYSTTSLPNPTNQSIGNLQNNKVLAVFGSTQTPAYNSDISGVFKQIFGFSNNQAIKYIDNLGLNYNIVFNIQNTIINGNENINNLEFTNVLNFPIRRITKLIQNEI